jgi:hypothetical protein
MRWGVLCAYSCFRAGSCPTKKERSEKLLNQDMEPRDSGSVEDAFATPAGGGRELLLSLTAQEAKAILARAQERAAIEAEDFWGQAEEACSVDPIG